MEALKPEAAYFYPEDGKRTAIMIFDMKGSWQLPATVEPLFQALVGQGDWGRPIATRIYARARPSYHSVTQAGVDRVLAGQPR